MIQKMNLATSAEDMHNITRSVAEIVRASGVESGLCLVYCPHTTAGVTINENADSDVVTDLLYGLNQAFPDRRQFRHAEGNSAAHLKASVVGSSVTIPIQSGRLLLGTWQGIYFCEFDGPRSRTFYVQVV
ncbi:MAG: secondary thiamine-phosphate synthase enzyme YjbQ [Coriobacteriia bacterium]|nr:secondary thiamine-phosphate synthase enzyme YjbQ [Coriobacteriia bacterium]